MFKNFTPINNNILVELIEKEKTTPGGIIIPGEGQEKTQQATVLHSGKSTQLAPEDKVYFKKYKGTVLDEKHLVLEEEDILGIL